MITLGMTDQEVPLMNGQFSLAPATFENRYASWVKHTQVSANMDTLNIPSIQCNEVFVALATARARPMTLVCKAAGER